MMRSLLRTISILPLALAGMLNCSAAPPAEIPIRGLHLSAPAPDDVAPLARFIREELPKHGVNVLVLEFNYNYKFTRHPEVVDPGALSLEQVKTLLEACRESGVKLIPQINLLGHQSWAETTFGLLRAHPEFDETPGKYPGNKDIYCRSYCPLHPKVHEVVFDVIDELADACQAEAFHIGMDEVFLLGEDDCPRCKGKNKAELFAQEVRVVRDHLAKSNRTLWMWGDRFLDGDVSGLGKWEASQNATAPAIRIVPKDIMICDWHYERAEPTAAYFAMEGFRVVSSPWRKPEVALGQLEQIRSVRKYATETLAGRMMGVLHTTWCGAGPFLRAYYREGTPEAAAKEAAETFRQLFEAIGGK